MKSILIHACLLLTLVASAQKRFSFVASPNFNFAATGFGANDAGIGFTLSPGFVATPRLRATADASLDHFFGNKLAYVDANGNITGYTPTVLSVKIGPEFFVLPNVSVAALYGLSTFKDVRHRNTNGSLKFAVTAYVGSRKRGVLSFGYSLINDEVSAVRFCGLHAGYRIF